LSVVQVELRPFEIEIIRNFKTFSPITGGGKSRPRKGVWIRAHLQEVGEDHIYSMWKRWRSFAIAARFQDANLDIGTYASFRTYMFLLKKKGLVIPTRRERARTTRLEFRRQYYTVNTRTLRDPRWLNPFAGYPGWQKWKRQGFSRPKKKPRAPRRVLPPSITYLGKEELKRLWAAAEKFLRAHGYTLTRAELENIIPDWGLEALKYASFKEKVGYVIHEAVEVEEVKRAARRLIDPRMAPEPVRLRAHDKAEEMQKEWMRIWREK